MLNAHTELREEEKDNTIILKHPPALLLTAERALELSECFFIGLKDNIELMDSLKESKTNCIRLIEAGRLKVINK